MCFSWSDAIPMRLQNESISSSERTSAYSENLPVSLFIKPTADSPVHILDQIAGICVSGLYSIGFSFFLNSFIYEKVTPAQFSRQCLENRILVSRSLLYKELVLFIFREVGLYHTKMRRELSVIKVFCMLCAAVYAGMAFYAYAGYI